MIIGLGLDLCDIARIERAIEKPHFLRRVFTEAERARIAEKGAQTAAGCFAAKEAVAKAFGTGISGFGLCDIEVLVDALGKPYCALHGGARARLDLLGGGQIFLSITHSQGFAAAVAVIER